MFKPARWRFAAAEATAPATDAAHTAAKDVGCWPQRLAPACSRVWWRDQQHGGDVTDDDVGLLAAASELKQTEIRTGLQLFFRYGTGTGRFRGL